MHVSRCRQQPAHRTTRLLTAALTMTLAATAFTNPAACASSTA
ncbi:hypothetical protein [Streptomyces cyaneofuscatus]